MKPAHVIISGVFLMSCNFNQTDEKFYINRSAQPIGKSESSYQTISEIPLPAGYKRFNLEKTSFGTWLGTIRLKRDKTIYLYNGEPKKFQQAQFAVLDISVGDKDLQQCADAVMRLRAEYLFQSKRYSEIIFRDNDGTAYNLHEPYNSENFNRYLNMVFSICGTASLSKQLHKKAFKDLQVGDVLIRGGFPGHAVIVVDAAINDKNEAIYMLAQSYMPAQDIHILVNPNDTSLSPWYKVGNDDDVVTPEYVFTTNELKEW